MRFTSTLNCQRGEPEAKAVLLAGLGVPAGARAGALANGRQLPGDAT